MTQDHIPHEPRDPLEFEPVAQTKRRADGWTAQRQREFIAMLAETGNVKGACAAVGLTHSGAYKLRYHVGAETFCAAWDAAVERSTAQVRDLMIDHALNGVPEQIVHCGKVTGERRRFDHRIMMHVTAPRNGGPTGKGAMQPPIDQEAARAELVERLTALAKDEWAKVKATPLQRLAYEERRGPIDWDGPCPWLIKE